MTSNGKVYLLVFCFVITPDLSMEGSDDYLNIEEKDLNTTVNLTSDSSLKDMLECTLYHEWALAKDLVNENKSYLFWYLHKSTALDKTVLTKMCSGKSTMNKSISVFLFKCLLAQLHNIPNTNCEGFDTAVDISTGLSASGPTPTHTPTTSTPLPSKTKTPAQSAATPAKGTASSDRRHQSGPTPTHTPTTSTPLPSKTKTPAQSAATPAKGTASSDSRHQSAAPEALTEKTEQRRRPCGWSTLLMHPPKLTRNTLVLGLPPPPGQGTAASRGGAHSGPKS
ncbi:uncharacterized protein [Nothobranchius furzeri]|uniref:uncharacterized protein isoform X2 n=1 Tax=Nothobranchius furzeri TaxID=105023 RepID=UPI003904AAE6